MNVEGMLAQNLADDQRDNPGLKCVEQAMDSQ